MLGRIRDVEYAHAEYLFYKNKNQNQNELYWSGMFTHMMNFL